MKSYKELIVWQKSIELVLLVYQGTVKFPPAEKYSLVSQMRRAAVSIPSNIAEGYTRNNLKEYIQFLHISFSSLAELETQIIISSKLNFLKEKDECTISALTIEIGKMLNKLIFKLKEKC